MNGLPVPKPTPWTAEIEFTADDAKRLIEQQFPTLSLAEVKLQGVGWDNFAFLVNGDFIFRFPRRAFAAPLIAIESNILPTIAPLLPLPIPIPEFVGVMPEPSNWKFAGYRRLPGSTTCSARMTATQRTAVAKPLALFLKQLHSLATSPLIELGAPPDTIGRLEFPRRLDRARTDLVKLRDIGFLDNIDPLIKIIDDAPTDFKPRADTLVHGDLYSRHLLVDDAHALSGVIDWGDLHIGDAAIDLSIAHIFLPPEAHADFRKPYGNIESITWEIARLRAIWHTAYVALYALDIGDEDLLFESRFAFNNIVEASR
ncbi:MAG: phosphotransferase [Chthonomonadales bacterium]